MPIRRATRRAARSTAVLVAALALAAAVASPAVALEPDEVGVWPTWQVAGSSATAVFPASAAFPTTTLSTTQTRALTAPAGESAFLGSSTALGQSYGSSRSQPYLSIGPAGTSPSITTLTFGGAQPAGWGFALGDIDADWVYITAYAGPGLTNPLTVDQLGFQSAGNYCNNVPKPSACGAAGPYTDQPTWVTAPETFDGVTYVPGTLRGSATGAVIDTAGAYGWFMPTVPIDTLQLMFGVRQGIPTGQLWLVAPAPKVTLTGTVVAEGGMPPGTVAEFREADGDPILDLEDQPLGAPVGADGTYSVDLPQSADGYQVVVVAPDGYSSAGTPLLVPGIPPAGSLIVAVPPVTITANASPALPPPAAEEELDNRLAASGTTFDVAGYAAFVVIASALGVALVRRGRRVRS